METSLHQQLKLRYNSRVSRREVQVDGYRIDAIRRGTLIEVQQSSLLALRKKSRSLLDSGHRLHIVKPLAQRTQIIYRESEDGPDIRRRISPLHETPAHLFQELVYFCGVFPHPRLTLEVLLVSVEEHRVPASSGRKATRRSARRTRNGRPAYRCHDRILTDVGDTILIGSADDLWKLLPGKLPDVFHTGHLATATGIPRWLAQKAAYCLRKTGAAIVVGKQRGAWLYTRSQPQTSVRNRAA